MGKRKLTGTWGGAALALLTLTLASCATGGTGSSRGAGNVVTGEQLLEMRQSDLYTALQNLRPAWIRGRGSNSITNSSEVVVFLNGAPFGTASDLRTIAVDTVEDVQFMSASEAGARYGTTAGSSGLLLVRTRS